MVRERLLLLLVLGSSACAKEAPAHTPEAASSCNPMPSLGYKLVGRHDLPTGRTIINANVHGASSKSKHQNLAAMRAMFDSASPLDPCDPSIPTWEYGEPEHASVFLADGTIYQVDLFGSRGVLLWKDGTATMFDSGSRS